MPRIRTIKPEFWTAGQVLECSTNARLLFIGLWNFCDDAGRHPWRLRQIKAQIFPADDFSEDDIQRMLDELSSNGLIVPYEVEEQRYFQVTGWHHQRIDRPQKPKYPSPSDDRSSNTRRSLAPEGKGREGKEGESSLRSDSSTDPGEAGNGRDHDPPFLNLPCLENKTFPITEGMVAHYGERFPGIDVRQELRNAVTWAEDNPKRRKTLSGAKRFLTGWLTRAQNRGGGGSQSQRPEPGRRLRDL